MIIIPLKLSKDAGRIQEGARKASEELTSIYADWHNRLGPRYTTSRLLSTLSLYLYLSCGIDALSFAAPETMYATRDAYNSFFACPFSFASLLLFLHARISFSSPVTSGTATGPSSGR
jgi:hypothetical protein